jgi:ubiquinone/menaquinone biosynthesis C-methylase UbiE
MLCDGGGGWLCLRTWAAAAANQLPRLRAVLAAKRDERFSNRFGLLDIVPLIGSLITNASEEYRYLEESIFKFPFPADFAAIIEGCGFDVMNVSSLAAGVANIYIARPQHPAQ